MYERRKKINTKKLAPIVLPMRLLKKLRDKNNKFRKHILISLLYSNQEFWKVIDAPKILTLKTEVLVNNKASYKVLFWQHAFTDKEQSGERTLSIFHQIISGKIDKFLFPVSLQVYMK